MIKYLLTLVAIIYGNLIYAQNLTLDEVISLNQKSLAEAEEYLTAKNWEIMSIEQEPDSKMDIVTFAYKKSKYSDKAESFISCLYHSSVKIALTVNIQINSVAKYNTYLSALKAKGVKLIDTEVKNGSIKKTYQSKSQTFIVLTSTSKDDLGINTTTYGIIISNDGADN